MSGSSVCKLDSNQNHSLKHKLMKGLFKTKRPLCFFSPQCKSLDLRIHVAEQCKEEHIREASICILLWTQRLRRSSQLGPTRIVLHLHNLRESSFTFFAQDFSKSFWSLSVSFLAEWEACLFSAHSVVYTSAEGHFFANACFSGRLFVKCIMTCACPQAKSLRWNEVG